MKIRRRWRWLLDWKTAALLLASVIVALVIVVVVDGERTTHDALAARQATANAAIRRIDLLNGEVTDLTSLVKGESEQIGTLEGEVTALQGQVHQLGGTPVVPTTSTTTTGTTSPSRPSQPPTTTTTTPPPKQPPPSSHCLLGICVTK